MKLTEGIETNGSSHLRTTVKIIGRSSIDQNV